MGSSQLSQVVIVFLLLCVLPCLTASALPSHQQQRSLSVTGRKLMSIYRPNGDIFTRPSSSGHGGGRNPPH
ncbi:unnamed protein product [Microthlaspi erraticum]|uniref:Uncharacterized protein n=1 Tax=Microthlaspi erraticum TaxID=1685480 RepID=A0A6D2K4G7_9BRAS|nr:unnamed protein product [Microthlaspi erraticum]